ncbi:hypothetical protein [Variovorax sp. JS1663]|uniref:hypothetical protein n=1 Tax=Variovorax sp. JS1663 TaxID=1851577 RepID=UPI001863AA40|nr:hypothetical protein [Variovorax sp. JS1663]
MPSGTSNPAEMYGIVRGPGSHWIVALTRNGIHANRTFSFSKWGGHDAALASAQAWRDAFVRNHPQPTRQELATRLRSNNKSGIPGVIPVYGPDGEIRKWKAQTYSSANNDIGKAIWHPLWTIDNCRQHRATANFSRQRN